MLPTKKLNQTKYILQLYISRLLLQLATILNIFILSIYKYCSTQELNAVLLRCLTASGHHFKYKEYSKWDILEITR